MLEPPQPQRHLDLHSQDPETDALLTDRGAYAADANSALDLDDPALEPSSKIEVYSQMSQELSLTIKIHFQES